jgi:AcrR family transcriptional regulator
MRNTRARGAVGRPPKGDDGAARNRILEAAIAAFSENGIDASSIKEISRRAGVTPALVNYHFDDKEALISESLDRFVVPIVRRFWEAADLGLEPREMLEELIARVQAAAEKHPWFLLLWSRELANVGGRLRDFLKSRLDKRLADLFLETVLAGQRDGTVNPDLAPELVYVSLVSCVCLASQARPGFEMVFRSPVSDLALQRHVCSLLIHGLADPGERRIHDSLERGTPGPRQHQPRHHHRAPSRPSGRTGAGSAGRPGRPGTRSAGGPSRRRARP